MIFGTKRASFANNIVVKKFSKNEPAVKVHIEKPEKVKPTGHDMTLPSQTGGAKKKLRKSPAVRKRSVHVVDPVNF